MGLKNAGWFAAAMLAWSPASSAMHWCALPAITPAKLDDFDRIVPSVERLTGCKRSTSESAHEAEWVCADDPATDAFEFVQISLIRTPGESTNLLIASVGPDALDMLRACRDPRLRDGNRFEPGNVTLRDQLVLDQIGPALTLANSGPGTVSFLYTRPRFGSGDGWETGLVAGGFGIERVANPATKVRLAGLNPLDVTAEALVAAFQARGAKVSGTKDIGTALPEWVLTAPVGLAGVRQVAVNGYIRHVMDVEYSFATTADYERFVTLLDDEYGASSRKAVEQCTHRWWFSGSVSIRGRHCPDGNTVEFDNDVASSQLVQIVDKRKADEADGSDVKKPVIDSDMF
ncbi:hypothetical protein [Sphingomonas xinjiangensis]|uniref:Uncharacterized protein n=1 Tax=Sphingomonas xinjiangensis TaxID=643568 RepID=A0A840YKN4_9SPHN|nr:hypothetical protein [Sphingomonas xinjiangensis]MBB5711748.1 hypothetical protein [Sphingomonas xinjiangensis]